MSGHRRGHTIILWVAASLATCLTLVTAIGLFYPALVANVERVRTVRTLNINAQAQDADEIAWEAGWRSLCANTVPRVSEVASVSRRALPFVALASIDRGEYDVALEQFRALADQPELADMSNAPAYLAALEMNWTQAAKAYHAPPTARHRRFWATIFYLAAQQAMFGGDTDQAAEFYRQADAGYGAQGPYRGLGFVDCLMQRGRSLEAFDAYRRALVTMPAEEALALLPQFSQSRLEGLRAWHRQDPRNQQVTHWLDFYEAEPEISQAVTETLLSEPVPMVPLKLDLGESRALIGFDYRKEDIETGPFMTVDFYVREDRDEGVQFSRIRRTILNQAPNGAFIWDAVPDEVKPFGWYGLLYAPDLRALRYEIVDGTRRLCMEGRAIQESFGLESDSTPITNSRWGYAQGGQAFVSHGGALGHGRTWFDYASTPYPYSYVPGGHLQDEVESMAGLWEPATQSDKVAVWLFSDPIGRACAWDVYLFALPAI